MVTMELLNLALFSGYMYNELCVWYYYTPWCGDVPNRKDEANEVKN